METRFVSIWFPALITDWHSRRQPELAGTAFVTASPQRGRMVIRGSSPVATREGVFPGMVLADARALLPGLKVIDDQHEVVDKLLKKWAAWCIRFTPIAAIDPPDGILLDASGCAHLWGGEAAYLQDMLVRIQRMGYHAKAAIAGTIGTAWAVARYEKNTFVVPPGMLTDALLPLPPTALRLEPGTTERLHKLGLHTIGQFIHMPRGTLRRRFGQHILLRIDQALGHAPEPLQPQYPVEPYEERLPCLEPILTHTGISMALQQLLDKLCTRLQHEEKGLRAAVFRGYRMDGKMETIAIGTHQATHRAAHIFTLFSEKLETIEPDLGIELFTLTASRIDQLPSVQYTLLENASGSDDPRFIALIDRLSNKFGSAIVHRYLPAEHYWPERSFKKADSFTEKPGLPWRQDQPRPIRLLSRPEPIQVTAPVPDYPPMLFRHRGQVYRIRKADGPERIEQEWWIEEGEHRDYYQVEDENGNRYWVFRSGHYESPSYQWFLHGFFA